MLAWPKLTGMDIYLDVQMKGQTSSTSSRRCKKSNKDGVLNEYGAGLQYRPINTRFKTSALPYLTAAPQDTNTGNAKATPAEAAPNLDKKDI